MTPGPRSAGEGNAVALPVWAVAGPARREHIARVVTLLEAWASAMHLNDAERRAWHDAGAWHDALRDAPVKTLGPPEIDPTLPEGAWHGPAAAARLRADGESRGEVLDAITWHTVGHAGWGPVGRALYCADLLEPGRSFDQEERAALAARFPLAPDDVFRDVVRMRVERAHRRDRPLHPRTVELWESLT